MTSRLIPRSTGRRRLKLNLVLMSQLIFLVLLMTIMVSAFTSRPPPFSYVPLHRTSMTDGITIADNNNNRLLPPPSVATAPALFLATSSKELRNREESKKKARDAKRLGRRKRKTTSAGGEETNNPTTITKKKSKQSLTQRLQQATARAKAAAIEADYANKRQQQLEQQKQRQQEQQQKRQSSSSSSSVLLSSSPVVKRRNHNNSTDSTNPVMGTLRQLTKIIDQELRSASDGTATFNVHGTTNPPPGITRDSMRSLLEENDAQSNTLEKRRQQNNSNRGRLLGGMGGAGGSGVSVTTATTATTSDSSSHRGEEEVDEVPSPGPPLPPPKPLPVKHIAVILSKSLSQDQVTLEYACRLRTLAKAIQSGQQQQQHAIGGDDDVDFEENKKTKKSQSPISSQTDNINIKEAATRKSSDTDDDDEKEGEDGGTISSSSTTESFSPDIICFVGGTSVGNLISDADAGCIYFKHLCAANDISLDGIDIMLERTSLGKGALKHIMRHLQREYIPEWYKEQQRQQQQEEQEQEQQQHEVQATTSPSSSSSPSSHSHHHHHHQHHNHKVQLHFTFFSSDYDLCRLNDIHYRSPQQSILRPLLDGGGGNIVSNDDDDDDDEEEERWGERFGGGGGGVMMRRNRPRSYSDMVQTTWSYRYSTYPYVHFKDSVTAFLGKCYLLAQELTPVLVNIRGVVDGTEFFQRDNYRVLVSIRRSFVSDMERFYQSQPSLKRTLGQYVSNNDYPLDVVLEGALLSLGRCLDLVRPAGLLIGYVPKTDWKSAEMVLEHAVRQLRDACDPDHPLDPADWGKLDHHYDKDTGASSGGGESTDNSVEDLASHTHWRLEEEEEGGCGDDDDDDEGDRQPNHSPPRV